jgi:pimeloyl-ACP methyl ester carboxylesterase
VCRARARGGVFRLVFSAKRKPHAPVLPCHPRATGWLRGERAVTTLTINDHAGHLATLAEHLQIDRVHWIGHSSGCQIVLQLALEHPELVKTLTLLEPAAGAGRRFACDHVLLAADQVAS